MPPPDAFAAALQRWIDSRPVEKHIEWGRYSHLGGPLPWPADPDDNFPF